jgi:hypothetical protein
MYVGKVNEMLIFGKFPGSEVIKKNPSLATGLAEESKRMACVPI